MLTSESHISFLFQEELQKEAFAALQFQKDARMKRITGQIELIEQELSQLTVLELEQKQLKVDVQMVGASYLCLFVNTGEVMATGHIEVLSLELIKQQLSLFYVDVQMVGG